MKFTDYRTEFFGPIESKSIDWVVRARDRNNYYAMKFTLIQQDCAPSSPSSIILSAAASRAGAVRFLERDGAQQRDVSHRCGGKRIAFRALDRGLGKNEDFWEGCAGS
jgi:hypothetical protein